MVICTNNTDKDVKYGAEEIIKLNFLHKALHGTGIYVGVACPLVLMKLES